MSRSEPRFRLVVLALLLLSGSFALAQGGPVTLRLTWWGSQDRHDRTIEVIERYEAANPNIDIVFEFSGWGDYWTKVSTQAAGGQLACVMQHDYRYLGEWQSRGLLVPLDSYIESGVIDVSNIPDPMLSGGRLDGSTYGINLGSNSQAFMIDLDMVEQAGLELPDADWTWQDFEQFALDLHDRLGIWAIGPTLPDEALWKSLYLGHGTWASNPQGTALGYEDDQPLIDYFKMIMRLQDAGAIPSQQEATEFADVGPEQAPIVTKRAAMDYRWSNQVVAVWSASGEDRNFALLPLPRPEGGQSQNYIKPSMFFSITSQCDHPEEAAKFIDYFVNDLEVNEVLFAERGVPVSTTVLEHLQPMLDPAAEEMFAFLALVSADASPVPPADPPGWGDVLNNVYDPLVAEPVLYRRIAPERAVQILRQEANEILGQNAQ
jgi:multiple sugar transport system substrate-binding protein